MTDDLRERLKFRGPMKAVSVFMVVRLEFADGSVYSDEPTLKALQEYFEQVGAKVPCELSAMRHINSDEQ